MNETPKAILADALEGHGDGHGDGHNMGYTSADERRSVDHSQDLNRSCSIPILSYRSTYPVIHDCDLVKTIYQLTPMRIKEKSPRSPRDHVDVAKALNGILW